MNQKMASLDCEVSYDYIKKCMNMIGHGMSPKKVIRYLHLEGSIILKAIQIGIWKTLPTYL